MLDFMIPSVYCVLCDSFCFTVESYMQNFVVLILPWFVPILTPNKRRKRQPTRLKPINPKFLKFPSLPPSHCQKMGLPSSRQVLFRFQNLMLINTFPIFILWGNYIRGKYTQDKHGNIDKCLRTRASIKLISRVFK